MEVPVTDSEGIDIGSQDAGESLFPFPLGLEIVMRKTFVHTAAIGINFPNLFAAKFNLL
jgi:hypothetical protein